MFYILILKIMLKEMGELIPQKPFEAGDTLKSLNILPLETEEDRLKFMIEILQFKNVLNIKLTDNIEFFNDKIIRQLIADASTHSTKSNVISFKFSLMLYNLNFEFYKKNNGKFDFKIFKDYLDGKAKFEDFIKTPKKVTEANSIWSFKGLNGMSYTGKGLSDLFSLKGPDVKNILTGYSTEDEDIRNIIIFLYDKKNEKIIKKNSSNVRVAALSVLKSIIGKKDLQEQILNYIK